MRKETFSKRKIGKQLVSVMMLGLAVSSIILSGTSVLAEEKAATTSAASDVDKKLQEAIAKAKSLGVQVQTEGRKEFQSTAEANAFKQTQLNNINQAISKAEADKAAADKEKSDYDAAKKKYDEDKKKYDAEIAKMEADKNKEGHLSQAAAQSLIYQSEPNAKANASDLVNAQPITSAGIKRAFDKVGVNRYYIDELVNNKEAYDIAMSSVGSTEESLSTARTTGLGNGKDTITAYRIAKNGSVTVNYTNLKNSSYNGEPLSKVSMTISIDPSSQNISDNGIVAFTQNPSLGFNVVFRRRDDSNNRYMLKFNVTMKFYDSKGNLINLTDENKALLGMSSFNSHQEPVGTVEGFAPGQGTSVIDITGSSIQNQGGRYYSVKPENSYNQFGQGNIDSTDSPYFWYLGSVLQMTGSSPTFQIFSGDPTQFGRPQSNITYLPGLWMTATSELATKVITKPTPPALTNATTAPSEPVKITDAVVVNTTHVEVGTNKELAPKEEGTKPKKSIDGYEFVETKTKDGNTIHYYTPKKPEEPKKPDPKPEVKKVITKHIDITNGKELHPQEEGTKPKRSFDGYEFVETKTEDGNTIHFYKPIDKTPIKPKEDKKVYTRHYDITTGKELTKQEDGTQPKRTFDGYEFVETKTKDGDTEHYYKPVAKPITRHIDKETGNELTPPEEGNKPKKDIPGYRFVETKDKDGNTEHYYQKVRTRHYDVTTGKEISPQEDGTQPKKDIPGYEFVETKDKDGDTEHFYKPVKKVVTKHIDKKTGKELVPQEDGTQPKKDIAGYRFVETKDEDGNTVHYYEQVITKHINIENGEEIAPQEDGTQPKKDIEGFEFVETKDENGDTHHFYRPIKKVYTKHIDKETGKELAPQEDGKQPKRTFDGYEFVETKDENGNTIHYYQKVEPVAQIKGKTPAKYAETNESSGMLTTLAGLSLASVLAFFVKKRKSN